MILAVHAIPEADRLAALHDRIALLQWRDGRETAGAVAREVKRNEQAAMDSTAGRSLADEISQILWDNPVIRAAAQPRRFSHLLISRTGEGGGYGAHVDNALMGRGERRVRTDLSFTLFLTPPEDYDGGELTVEDTYGAHEVKLPAGDLILYPASSLHQVTPVTRGARVASFFWIQSLVRDVTQRSLLFDMDVSIQRLAMQLGQGDPSLVALTGTYHNLLRMWAEV